MAKQVHTDVQDNGLSAIKSGALSVLILNTYTAGDIYATVVANALAVAAVDTTDFVIETVGGVRQVRFTGATGTADVASSGTPDLHIAFTNGVDKVLWVTKATNTTVALDKIVHFPTLAYASPQPV